MSNTYFLTDEEVELTQWRTVRNLVSSVLPAPFSQGRSRLESASREPKPACRTAGPKRPVEGRQAVSASADQTDMVATQGRDRQAIPDRHTAIITAFNGGKWFASKVADAAVMWAQVPDESSGVNWKSGSQGLELILNSGREYIGRPNEDYNPEFERAAYIHGAQHVLRGLPRDLEPAEVAMLRRALPPNMAASTSRPIKGGEPQAADSPRNRNWVHTFALCLLGFMSALIAWMGPQVVNVGAKAIRLETQHKYCTRSLAMAIRRLCQVFRWAIDSMPGRLLSQAFEYISEGVYGALQEFTEKQAEPGWMWEQEQEQYSRG